VEQVGVCCAGNFIIDHVKVVDLWPDEGMLSLILEERRANGGCAYNVLKDIALLKTNLPLFGVGVIGGDADGKFILNDLKKHDINSDMITCVDGTITSYTDVITVKKTGNRTFFHNKGANKFLDIKHFDFSKINTKLFHIGYILLLDTLDGPDTEYGTVMARLLKMAKSCGLKTSVDVVSESSYRFNKIVLPALKYTDYLILNEIEAGRTSGFEIREKNGQLNIDNLKKSLSMLMENGNSELICIHFPEGAFAITRNEIEKGIKPHFASSHLLPDDFIEGTVGAGDAFCAGMLYGIHEGWDIDKTMKFANAMASMCLSGTSASDGMKSIEETLKFMDEMPLRKGVIK